MGILDNGKSFEGEIGIWMVSLGVKEKPSTWEGFGKILYSKLYSSVITPLTAATTSSVIVIL